MGRFVVLCGLLLLCLFSCFDTASSYTLEVSSTNVSMLPVPGSVTVTVSGSCSHYDLTGCYDFIAAYQVGACESGAGENTCYMKQEWQWISSLTNNQWKFTFDGPGLYEFRISYCGCGTCLPGLDDLVSCPSYENEGTSDSVTVSPPFDLSPYSPTEQLALGVLYVSLEGVLSELEQVLAKPPAESSCSSCLCDVESLDSTVDNTVNAFESLYNSFSFDELLVSISDLASVAKGIVSAMDTCAVDQIVGTSVTHDLIEAAAAWVTGLQDVKEIVNIAIGAENVYCDIANAMLAWNQSSYFTSGVFIARLANVVLSAVEGNVINSQAQIASSTANVVIVSPQDSHQHLYVNAMTIADGHVTRDSCVLRHPGGVWETCDCAQARDSSKHPGNRCRPLKSYGYRTTSSSLAAPTSGSTSSPSNGFSTATVVGLCIGSAAAALVVAGFVTYLAMRVRRRKLPISRLEDPLLSAENATL